MTGYGDEIHVKVVLLGQTNVGKTSLVHYIIYDEPIEISSTTIAAQHSKLSLHVPIQGENGKSESQLFKLSIWDTGGQERFAQVCSLQCPVSLPILTTCQFSRFSSFILSFSFR